MRFMMLMIPNIPTDRSWTPDAETVGEMSRYNEALAKAGVLLALDGLHPPAAGARVRFAPGEAPAVTDGPFTEAKEIIGGYWIIQTKTREEAIEWASRVPVNPGEVAVELRQIFELSDFPEEVQALFEDKSPPEQPTSML